MIIDCNYMTEKNVDSRIKHKCNINSIKIKAMNKNDKKNILFLFEFDRFRTCPMKDFCAVHALD